MKKRLSVFLCLGLFACVGHTVDPDSGVGQVENDASNPPIDSSVENDASNTAIDSSVGVDASVTDASNEPDVLKANFCAIPGASYLVHFTQMSGNCGYIPDVLVNINPDGSLPYTGLVCQSLTTNGCTSQGTNCQFSFNGINCTETFTTTFNQDGSGGQSTIQVACQGNGVSCSSIYDATYTKQ